MLTISAADLKNIANITDGDTFTITNKAGTSVTFELDTTGKVYGTASATYVPINLSKLPAGYTPQNTLDAIENAINGVAGFGIPPATLSTTTSMGGFRCWTAVSPMRAPGPR